MKVHVEGAACDAIPQANDRSSPSSLASSAQVARATSVARTAPVFTPTSVTGITFER